MSLSEDQIYEVTILLWGIQKQSKKFLEEMVEAMDAWFTLDKDHSDENERAFIRELVDAEIMINQVVRYYDHEYFKQYKAQKLKDIEGMIRDRDRGRFILEQLGIK